jgi:hypothetical protein
MLTVAAPFTPLPARAVALTVEMLTTGATPLPEMDTTSVSVPPLPSRRREEIVQVVEAGPRVVGVKVTARVAVLPVMDATEELVGENGEESAGKVTEIVWLPAPAARVAVIVVARRVAPAAMEPSLTSTLPRFGVVGLTVMKSAEAGAAIVSSDRAEDAEVRIVLFTT